MSPVVPAGLVNVQLPTRTTPDHPAGLAGQEVIVHAVLGTLTCTEEMRRLPVFLTVTATTLPAESPTYCTGDDTDAVALNVAATAG
jgi:hypothetical protein